ncbi:hypothetical protein AWENTII_010931 [Aspergillus wentii]
MKNYTAFTDSSEYISVPIEWVNGDMHMGASGDDEETTVSACSSCSASSVPSSSIMDPGAQTHPRQPFFGGQSQPQASTQRLFKSVTDSRDSNETLTEGEAHNRPGEDVAPQTLSIIHSFVLDALDGLPRAALDMLRSTFSQMRRPLQSLLVLYLTVYIALWGLIFLYQHMGEIVCSEQSPLRRLCKNDAPAVPPPNQKMYANFSQTCKAQEELGTVFKKAGQGANLALKMKSSEHAVRDLAMRVSSSDLDSKQVMAQHLVQIVQSSDPIVSGLSELSAKVSTVVNSVIANDKYAIRSLRSIEAHRKLQYSPVIRALTIIDPFGVLRSQTVLATDEAELKDSFIKTVASIVKGIPFLIEEAERVKQKLRILEAAVQAISHLSRKEELIWESRNPSTQKRDILEILWDFLTNDKIRRMEVFQNHSVLLKDLAGYYKEAIKVIDDTIVTLHDIQKTMNQFRDAHTRQVFIDSETPLAVRIDIIRSAVDNLNNQMLHLGGRDWGDRWEIEM